MKWELFQFDKFKIIICMKWWLGCFIALIFLPVCSCGQSEEYELFDERDYNKVRMGPDLDYPYVIVFYNKRDTNYSLREVYFDESYTQLLWKSFFYKNVPEGPWYTYVNGDILTKGFYKAGRKDGERITYRNGKISQKAYFKDGKKVSVWEEYDANGKLTRKTVYNNDVMVNDTRY